MWFQDHDNQSTMAFLPIAVDMSDRLGISMISDLAKAYNLATVARDQDMAGTWEYSLLLHLMHSASPMYLGFTSKNYIQHSSVSSS